jgi:hypothetical protein
MKKLTAGIFATIMGLTAVNAYAAEKIATTNYVKGAMTAAQEAAVAAVEAKDYATKGQAEGYANAALTSAQTYAEGQASAAQAAAEATAKGYTDGKLGTMDGFDTVTAYVTDATSGIVSEGTVSALDTRVKTLEDAATTYETSAHATATYETKTNVSAIEGRVDALETADTTFFPQGESKDTWQRSSLPQRSGPLLSGCQRRAPA